MYDGEWKNDQYHGKGIELWDHGAIVYEGQFLDGEKTKGKLTFGGNEYEGDFLDGKFEG